MSSSCGPSHPSPWSRPTNIRHHSHSNLQAAWVPSLEQGLPYACSAGQLGWPYQHWVVLHASCHLHCPTPHPSRMKAPSCSLHDSHGPDTLLKQVLTSLPEILQEAGWHNDRGLLQDVCITPSGLRLPLPGSSFSSPVLSYTAIQSLHPPRCSHCSR